MFRGEHHPTDILGSLVFAALWLTATTVLIKPSPDRQARPHPAAAGDGQGRRDRPGTAAVRQ
jgi:undecaprenyl-diphosphatase